MAKTLEITLEMISPEMVQSFNITMLRQKHFQFWGTN